MKKLTCFIVAITFILLSLSSCMKNSDIDTISSNINNIYDEIESLIDDSYDYGEYSDTLNGFGDIYSEYSLYEIDDVKYLDLDNFPELTFWSNCEEFYHYTDEELKDFYTKDFDSLINDFSKRSEEYKKIKSNLETLIENYSEFYQSATNADDLELEIASLTNHEETKEFVSSRISEYEDLQRLTLNYISTESNLSDIRTSMNKIDFDIIVTQFEVISSQHIFDIGLSRDEIKNLCINGLSPVVSALSSYEKHFDIICENLDNFEVNVKLIRDYTKNNLETLKYYFNATELSSKQSVSKEKNNYSYIQELKKQVNYGELETLQIAEVQQYIYLFADEYSYQQTCGKSKNKFLSKRMESINFDKKSLTEYIIISVLINNEKLEVPKGLITSKKKVEIVENSPLSKDRKEFFKSYFLFGTNKVDTDKDGLNDTSFENLSTLEQKEILP